jgi:hypothetical protein
MSSTLDKLRADADACMKQAAAEINVMGTYDLPIEDKAINSVLEYFRLFISTHGQYNIKDNVIVIDDTYIFKRMHIYTHPLLGPTFMDGESIPLEEKKGPTGTKIYITRDDTCDDNKKKREHRYGHNCFYIYNEDNRYYLMKFRDLGSFEASFMTAKDKFAKHNNEYNAGKITQYTEQLKIYEQSLDNIIKSKTETTIKINELRKAIIRCIYMRQDAIQARDVADKAMKHHEEALASTALDDTVYTRCVEELAALKAEYERMTTRQDNKIYVTLNTWSTLQQYTTDRLSDIATTMLKCIGDLEEFKDKLGLSDIPLAIGTLSVAHGGLTSILEGRKIKLIQQSIESKQEMLDTIKHKHDNLDTIKNEIQACKDTIAKNTNIIDEMVAKETEANVSLAKWRSVERGALSKINHMQFIINELRESISRYEYLSSDK